MRTALACWYGTAAGGVALWGGGTWVTRGRHHPSAHSLHPLDWAACPHPRVGTAERLTCFCIPSVMSTWERMQLTHMFDGFGWMFVPHKQHSLHVGASGILQVNSTGL